MTDDVIVVGAGIVGCACAYFLARDGARVSVFDASDVASGASGRNAGLVEHPYDAAQDPIYHETVSLLTDALGDAMPKVPAGVLILVDNGRQADDAVTRYARFPGLDGRLLTPEHLEEQEPLLGSDLWACRLETGYPVHPALATRSFADRARDSGARFRLGQRVNLLRDGAGIRGVDAGGSTHNAGAVVVAAGAASSAVIDPTGAWRPVSSLWGVSVQVSLRDRPRQALISGQVAEIQAGATAGDTTAFSLIATTDSTALGSTFLASKPSGESWVQRLLNSGLRFWPGLADARISGVLTCARPRGFDGRPLVGRVTGVPGLWLVAGHGGRGISTGPATARLVADALRSDSDAAIPEPLRADRFTPAVPQP
jgi:glycine/D-amino acid oxidase-like deaminating enzyme